MVNYIQANRRRQALDHLSSALKKSRELINDLDVLTRTLDPLSNLNDTVHALKALILEFASEILGEAYDGF